MANVMFYPIRGAYGREMVLGTFTFTANGASAPSEDTLLYDKRMVGSLAHTGGTNEITVTLAHPFPGIRKVKADVIDDAGDGSYVTVGDRLNEGTSTPPSFVLNFFDADGTPQNDPTSVVEVEVIFSNTIAQPPV